MTRTLGLALALLGAAPARAEPAAPMAPVAAEVTALRERLVAELTPAARAVLHPMPELTGTTREDELRFMATLGWRLEARGRYADEAAWRVIMGWPEPLDTIFTWSRAADDRSPSRYPVPAGREDPALDFAASFAVGVIDPVTLSCRFPLRARFLLRHGLVRGPLALDEGRCPVDRWAGWPRVEAVELVYVTPSFDDPSASMGHVIFVVRHDDDGMVLGASFAPTFAYSAVEEAATTPAYLVRGIVGGLTASMKHERMGDVYRRYALEERRDLVRYELVLSREELHDLLAEAYAQRADAMAVPYRFFAVNCASLAFDLVRAVAPDVPERSSFMTHPHEVVSRLVAAGRLRPREVTPSQRTRALAAEARQAALAPRLAARSGFAALHASRVADPATRAVALERFTALEPIADATLADYVDAVIDVEAYALVLRDGRFDPAASSAPLDAALDLRARLPRRESSRDLSMPPHPITPAASRQMGVSLGVSGAGRLEAGLVLALVDEQAGEARAAWLRRTGRTVILRSETRLSTDGASAPALERERLVLFESATWGIGVATDRGWLASHGGLIVSLTSESWPREDMPFSLGLRVGPGLTLAADADASAHLVVGVDVALEAWAVDAARFRAGLGPFVELALPLGSADNRWRLAARAHPTWAWDGGFGVGVELDTALDLALDARAGLLLRPTLTWRHGAPAGNGLRFALGLVW